MIRPFARAPPFFLLVGSLTLALSGCLSSDATGGRAATDAAPTADFDAETCGLVGSVLDDSALPLEGAVVSLAGRDRSTETVAGGGYAFHNLPPGHYYVAAHKKGHEDANTPEAVSCEAGAEAEAPALILVATGGPTEAGFKTDTHRKGIIRCGGHVASANLAEACGGLGVDVSPNIRPPLPPADPTTVPLEAGRVTGAVVELDWQPSAGLVGPQVLRVQLPPIADSVAWTHETTAEYETVHNEAQHTHTILVAGPSPIRLRLEAAPEGALWTPQSSTPDHRYIVRDFIEDTALPSVALLVDQRFDLYVTYFYDDLPIPADYTMLPA